MICEFYLNVFVSLETYTNHSYIVDISKYLFNEEVTIFLYSSCTYRKQLLSRIWRIPDSSSWQPEAARPRPLTSWRRGYWPHCQWSQCLGGNLVWWLGCGWEFPWVRGFLLKGLFFGSYYWVELGIFFILATLSSLFHTKLSSCLFVPFYPHFSASHRKPFWHG